MVNMQNMNKDTALILADARLEIDDAAVLTLAALGYTYHGGEQWKPPVGKPPAFDLIDSQRARIVELESDRNVKHYRIMELEAQLEALEYSIGAGGVETLRKRDGRTVLLSDVIARLEQGFGAGSAPVTTLLHYFSEELCTLRKREQEPATNQRIAGAIFSFAGYLTTLPKDRAFTVSECNEASRIVEEIQAWAAEHGLPLDDARVQDWQQAAPPAQATAAAMDAIRGALSMFPMNIDSQSFAVTGVNNGQKLRADGDYAFFSKKKVIAFLEQLLGHIERAAAQMQEDATRVAGQGQAPAAPVAHPHHCTARSADGACEECAVTCDRMEFDMCYPDPDVDSPFYSPADCSGAIRARGITKG